MTRFRTADRFRAAYALLVFLTLLAIPLTHSRGANANQDKTPPLPDACSRLQVEAGNKMAFRTYATGFQIYRWDGAAWVFMFPEATLFTNGNGVVGTHYVGPTWESNSGSKVVGAVRERCTPNPDAIPWLKLEATYTQGPGIFDRVTYIQRVNTTGGLAPKTPGNFPGDVAHIPYTAEYVYYRAKND